MKIKELFNHYETTLSKIYSKQESHSAATVLMEELHGVTRYELSCEREKCIDVDSKKVESVCEKILVHQPIQYITGCAYFFDRKFGVNANTLIPRGETEELVYEVIKDGCKGKILDIGTGSGAIAITLALELSDSTVEAVDISSGALATARDNCRNLGANVEFRECDILCDTLPENYYDVIVSNPPYVTDSEKSLMQSNVLDYEPHTALFVADNNPLLFYRRIATLATTSLKSEGKIYFEINEAYGKECVDMLKEMGFSSIVLKKDLNDKDRVVKAIYFY